jgi:uncharacterized membrane protein YeaQ/YmgE (transglycosylase-associated protein family)
METNTTSTKAGLKYGVYGGIALLLFSLVTYVSGIAEPTNPEPPTIIKYLPLLIMATVMVLGIKFFKENNEGFLSIGEGIVTAIVAGLIMSLISMIWLVVYFYIIDPTGLETLRENIFQMTVEKGSATAEQLEAAKGFMDMMTSIPAMLIISLIYSTIIGLIVGLIASLVMKNNRD